MEDKRKRIQNLELMGKRLSKGSIDVARNNLVKEKIDNLKIYEEDELSVIDEEEISKKDEFRFVIFYLNICEILSSCYYSTANVVNNIMHSVAVNILVLISTMFALFNVDLKILLTRPGVDPIFAILNEIIFILLTMEFVCLILFKKKYVGSFFFYLDLMAILSMIPDTEFLMNAFTGEENDDPHGSLGTTSHLIKASAASQAGARASRYLKIIRLLTFIKIIRLAKVLETAKELKSVQNTVDVTSLTLADLVLSKRKLPDYRGGQNNRTRARGSMYISSVKKVIIESVQEPDYRGSLLNPLNLVNFPKITKQSSKKSSKNNNLIKIKDKFNSSIKVPNIDPNIGYDNQKIDYGFSPNNLCSNMLDLQSSSISGVQENNSRVFLINNCNFTLLNVTNTYNCASDQKEILSKLDNEELESSYNSQDEEHEEHYENSENDELGLNPLRDSSPFQIQLDVLEPDDIAFINKDAKSENGEKNFVNPLKKDLDNFLKLNAIEIEDLIKDDNLVILEEKTVTYKTRRTTSIDVKKFMVNMIDFKNIANYNIPIKEHDSENSHSICSSSSQAKKSSMKYDLTFSSNKSKSSKNSKIIYSKKSDVSLDSSIKSSNRDNDSFISSNISSDNTKLLKKSASKFSKSKTSKLVSKNHQMKSEVSSIKIDQARIEINRKGEVEGSYRSGSENRRIQQGELISDILTRSISKVASNEQMMNQRNSKLNTSPQKRDNNSVVSSVECKGILPDITHNLRSNVMKFNDIQNFHKNKKEKSLQSTLAENENSVNSKKKYIGNISSPKMQQSKKRNQNFKDGNSDKSMSHNPETNMSLEDKLSEKLANKLVVLIMCILIVLPILDLEYFDTLLYTPDETPTVQRYCLEALNTAFIKSLENPIYFKSIFIIYHSCLDLAEDGLSLKTDYNFTASPYFFYFNFTQYTPFKNLMKNYQSNEMLYFKNLSYSFLPNNSYNHIDWDFVFENERNNINYMLDYFYPDESDSRIQYSYNNNLVQNLTSFLNVLKVVFIAIVLLLGAYIFSNDIHHYVTRHLDKVMTRLKIYINNTDSLSEEINADSVGKGDLRSTYEKALLLLDQRESNIVKKKKRNDETEVIDRSIKVIINLISMSIGKPILNIIQKMEIDQMVSLNLKTPGIKINAAFLMLKIENTDKFIKKYKHNANKILSKVYSVFHNQGIIYQGDIFTGKNVILWKEDRENTISKFKLYVYKLLGEKSKKYEKLKLKNLEHVQDSHHVSEDVNKFEKFEYIKENIHNMSYLCANKILYHFYNKLAKTIEILKDQDVRINLLLNYSELLSGYVGYEKIEEVYTSPNLIESEKILTILNQRQGRPAVYLHNNFFENLSPKLDDLLLPCDIVKVVSSNNNTWKINRIYKVYANPHLLVHRDEDLDLKQFKEDILAERKLKLTNVAKYFGKIEDFVISDRIIETYLKMNISISLKSIIKTFFDYLQKNKLKECVVFYRKLKVDEEYKCFRDEAIKKHLKEIEAKIKENLKSKSHSEEDNFTFCVNIS